MQTFKVQIEITAETKEQVQQKMQALSSLMQSLDHNDLVATAEFVEQNPRSIMKLKNWIENPPIWARGIISKLKGNSDD